MFKLDNEDLKGITFKLDYNILSHRKYMDKFEEILKYLNNFSEDYVIYHERNYNIGLKTDNDELLVKL